MEWKLNEVNQVPRGTVIFNRGDAAEFLLLVLKGHVAVYDENIRYTVGSGSVLGITDMDQNRYRANYIALENTIVIAWKNGGRVGMKEILNQNAASAPTIAMIMGRQLYEFRKLYQSLLESAVKTYKFLKDSYQMYLSSGNEGRAALQPISVIDDLSAYVADFDRKYGFIAEYYLSAARIAQEIQKKYFASSAVVAVYYICEGAGLQQLYIEECGKLMQYNEAMLGILISEREDCFFKRVAKRLLYLAQFQEKNATLSNMLDDILEKINGLEDVIGKNKYSAKLPDHAVMEKLYYNVLSGENGQEEDETQIAGADRIMQDMDNVTEKLLDFAGANDELREKVLRTLEEFRNMKNKTATDDQSRALRREIQDWFFRLYEAVFFREYKEKTGEKYVSMFLDYGVVDEKLLTKEQIMELFYLEVSNDTDNTYAVYTMSQWLTEIYKGRKMPSKNEFNMDYEEYLRDMKKTRSFSSPEEEQDYERNPARKVQFEIKNVFKLNARVLSGQPVVAVPFLHSDTLQGNNLSSMRLRSQQISEAFEALRAVDITLFARERMYAENELKLSRAYVVETVFPEFLLFPMAGSNAVMWQEISGRRKNTKGRFLFPILFSGMLQPTCTHLAGQFRWELVRTIQGTSWNDLRNKSLTSEYADYIQFYRKNRDLSEDRKEKLKTQLSKYRNNMREVFAEDYGVWVNSEANGAMRLSKPPREILAMYCPFAPQIRQRLAGQPAFSDAMKRYTMFQMEKVKETAYVIREYEKKNKEIPEILIETKKYYDET